MILWRKLFAKKDQTSGQKPSMLPTKNNDDLENWKKKPQPWYQWPEPSVLLTTSITMLTMYTKETSCQKKSQTSGKSHPGRWPHQLVLISAPRVVETTSIRDGICVNLVRNYYYHNKGSDPKDLWKLHPHPSVFVGKVKERSGVGQQLRGVVGLA